MNNPIKNSSTQFRRFSDSATMYLMATYNFGKKVFRMNFSILIHPDIFIDRQERKYK